jgi:hypothetical protein
VDDLTGMDAGDGTTFVVRLSRTAQGVRTYTVGASIPDGEYKPDTVERLFDLERAIVAELDGVNVSSKRSGGSLTAQLRRTIILNVLRQSGGIWMATAVILDRTGGAVRSRSQLVADLSALVRDGLVEYEAGGKGRGASSRYRLVAK